MKKYRTRRINDAVHGTIGLSEPEMALLSTQAFQRLRNVKQLGLAHLVFPGADYSRFSHSVGVNHITGRILDSVIQNTGKELEDADYELYRLAGLLHDVGHYPFSHTFENAVSTFYQNQSQPMLFLDDTDSAAHPGQLHPYDGSKTTIDSLSHEEVGKLLLEIDPEVNEVLAKYEINPSSIHQIFSRDSSQTGNVPAFANLISSDLDADRIDYLSRTAHHTGLPYGSVDIDYLLSQMRLDNENRICLDPSALRTAEHFLLGRYFDYQQVNFHKTVAALEWALHDVVYEMLRLNKFDCSPNGIRSKIASGEWYSFDDSYIMRLARDLYGDTQSETIRAKVTAITKRIPPKLIGSFEFFEDRTKLTPYNFCMHFLSEQIEKLGAEFNIPKDLWFVWGSWKMSFTKSGSYLPASMTRTDLEENADAIAQVVRIKYGDSSKLINEVSRSLMSILAQSALFSARLYVILPQDSDKLASQIADYVENKIASTGGLANWFREQ